MCVVVYTRVISNTTREENKMNANHMNIFTPVEIDGRTWYTGTIKPKQTVKVAPQQTHENGVSYDDSTYERGCYCWVCAEAFLHN